jgi:signal transduction histidine kinase
VSLASRLAAIVALASMLLAGSVVGMLGMRREYRQRLVERAHFEAERALVRVDGGTAGQQIVEECSVGVTRAGASGGETLLARLPAPRLGALTPGDTFTVTVQGIDGPYVLAARGHEGGRTAWATVAITDAPTIAVWKAVAGALVAVTVLVVVVALDTLRRVRKAALALRSATDGLASDLRAPVPSPGIRELQGVSEGLCALATRVIAANETKSVMADALAREQRHSALGRMSAAIAHEIRNPLAAIKLHADLAREGDADPHDRAAALDLVTREVDRLDHLLGQLLAHARSASREERDVGDVAAVRVRALSSWAKHRGATLRCRGTGRATIDVGGVERALENLVRNAVEASASGAVDVEVRDTADAVIVEVRDDGPGVADEGQKRLFEPFFTTKRGGTGLGLSLARAVTRSHAGELEYRREHGWTTFRMTLPHD